MDPRTECLLGAMGYNAFPGEDPGGVFLSCDRGESFVNVGLDGEIVHGLTFDATGARMYATGYTEGAWAVDVPRSCDP